MKAVAVLTVRLSAPLQRRSLSAVLAPDNEGLPGGLLLAATEGRKSLRFRAESDSASTAVSTALALLRDIALFQEVWLLSRPMDAGGSRSP